MGFSNTGLKGYSSAMDRYHQIGGKLSAYIRRTDPSTQQIQGFLADLLSADELLIPMRDVVSRPSFASLRELSGTGSGLVQRDALLSDLSRSYLPKVIGHVKSLLDGMLDTPEATNVIRITDQGKRPLLLVAITVVTSAVAWLLLAYYRDPAERPTADRNWPAPDTTESPEAVNTPRYRRPKPNIRVLTEAEIRANRRDATKLLDF